jgi:hypothetical protein
MARVTYGALITELAGSIGGITFQRNSSGNVARLKPNMPVNSSVNQQLQQFNISKLIPVWSALSSANKTSWENFALAHNHVDSWGNVKILNGFQWFMSCNINLLLNAQATISSAPAWTAVSALPSFVLVADAGNFDIDWTPAIDLTGYRLIIYATPPLKQSSMKLRRSTFIIKKFDGGVTDTLAIETEYSSVFNVDWGDLFGAAYCNIIIRVKVIQEGTGLASPYTSALLKLN